MVDQLSTDLIRRLYSVCILERDIKKKCYITNSFGAAYYNFFFHFSRTSDFRNAFTCQHKLSKSRGRYYFLCLELLLNKTQFQCLIGARNSNHMQCASLRKTQEVHRRDSAHPPVNNENISSLAQLVRLWLLEDSVHQIHWTQKAQPKQDMFFHLLFHCCKSACSWCHSDVIQRHRHRLEVKYKI